MLEKDLAFQILSLVKHCLKLKESNWINEREIKLKTHEKKFVGLRAKFYSYFIHDGR